MSQSLSPPQPSSSRHRASSTNVRPPLTLNTLGRRRSSSCLNLPDSSPAPSRVSSPAPLTPVHNVQSVSVSAPPERSSMLNVLVARCLQLLHVSPKQHTLSWSAPSSPRSSSDEFVLPLSAAATKTSFGDVLTEKQLPQSRAWWQGTPSVHAPILFVIILFPLSTALVLFALSTLPISLSWPRTLADLAELGRDLHSYSQSGSIPMAHVIAVLSVTATWKHAWSIPGSVIWNVLAGALFSPAYATLLLTALTTLGSICATLLSMPLAPVLAHLFPRALDMTRHALEGGNDLDTSAHSKSPAWARLSILRLIGVVPWSGINIASGVCGVAISDCILGSFIGCLPWTAVTCQIGDILQTVATVPSPTPQTVQSLLTSPEIIIKLVFLSFLSLAPILARDRLRALISQENALSESGGVEERVPRWAWVQDWRSKIRLPSRVREQEQRQRELDVLVSEKRAMQP